MLVPTNQRTNVVHDVSAY